MQEDTYMLGLRPYRNDDAGHVISWIDNEYAFRQWSADRYQSYPITAADMNAYYEEHRGHADIWVMSALCFQELAGHFTLRFPDKKRDELRLGFVILNPSLRNRGYGKEMVSLAVQFAFEFINVPKVSLGVFEHNTPAIRCYRSCGFRDVPRKKPEQYVCMGEVWSCIEMELARF